MTAPPGAGDLLAARIDERRRRHAGLSPLGAAVLGALDCGLASDSRAMAKAFEVEHALILREIAGLERDGLLSVLERDARTLRTRMALI